jgi:transposase-like protein
MTKQVTKKKSTRISYTPEYRAEALGLADRVGVAEAARQLGIEGGLIYNWRASRHATVILPTPAGHPVKRISYATEVFHDQASYQEEARPQTVHA